MNTMRAWRFDHYGTPDVMSLRELPMPVPGPGEVLVKVLASGVNPSDAKNVSGHFKAPLPRVPGRDFAGVIVAGDGREYSSRPIPSPKHVERSEDALPPCPLVSTEGNTRVARLFPRGGARPSSNASKGDVDWSLACGRYALARDSLPAPCTL